MGSMFLPDNSLIESILGTQLKQGSFAALPEYWTNIVGVSHPKAYNEIYMALMRRGFTAAQINAWDSGAEYELDISLWWCLVYGAGLQAYDPKWVAQLDRRRNMLPTVEISNAGVWQAPGIPPPTGPGQAYAAPQERWNWGFGPPLRSGCYGGYTQGESNPYFEQ